ncbi:glycosyltransferase family A protein [Mycoplasma buteonis]|uniref:glycosyltransferase family A protein n=1 Tax=Mycoplasma buteonis TaxID=171280 RepID=UPI000566F780|nr:glycosyltransferase family A protein [Mycoplasma buteonis]
MKLSLISLTSNSAKEVDWYLKDLKDQSNQDFEVILCVNKNLELKGILKVVKEHLDFFKNRLVLVLNTKQNSFHHNLKSAFNLVKGEYVAVLNAENSLKKYYVQNMIDAATKANVDILEFKPRIVGSIRFKPKARLEEGKNLLVAQNSQIFAYSYPFIFNKIIRKSVVKKVLKQNIDFTNDSKLCTFFVYLLLMEAKTYMYLDYRIYREYFGSDIWFNTKNYLVVMNEIEQIFATNNLKLTQELRYARYYLVKLLITAFLTETSYLYKTTRFLRSSFNEKRSDKAIQKHLDLVAKMEASADYQNFDSLNFYMLKHTDETELLGKSISQLSKSKILDNLE